MSPPFSNPLSALLARLAERPASVVFDLDSTLIDNRPRQAQILRDYGAHADAPSFAAVTAKHFTEWDLRVALFNAGVDAAAIAAHAEPARRFWHDRFFTSAYCLYDLAIPGAADFARRVAQIGRVVYLTGRPPAMREGTLASLGRLGFPLPTDGQTQLLMKPEPALHDDAWKEQAVAQANAFAPVVGCFDNEPTHINAYRRAWPDAICVWLQTDQSGRPVELLPGIARLPHFAGDDRSNS